MKFTEKGEIALEIEALDTRSDSAGIRFTVSDTGVGIPQDKLEAIFEDFVQVDGSSTRRFGGTGLGLAISRKLVSLMGGEIEVRSREGAGSSFTFTVNFRLAESPQVEPSLPEPIRGVRVLVADHNAYCRHIMAELLDSIGCKTGEASGKLDATNMVLKASAQGTPYKMVFVELTDPENEFASMQSAFQNLPPDHQPHVVAIITVGTKLNADKLRSLGCDGWLFKPVKRCKLGCMIKKILEEGRQDGPFPANHPDSCETSVRIAEGLRVLLAEDNVVNQKVGGAILEKIGCNYDVVGDGDQALDALKTNKYDIVLMDVQMPVKGGLEAAREIREDSRWAQLPVIAMTGHATESDRRACLDAGMNDYLAKPVSVADIASMIHRWAGRQGVVTDSEIQMNNPTEGTPKDVLDTEKAIDMIGGDMELLKEILDIFVADLPRKLDDLRAGISTGDATLVKRAAHSLKGSSSNICAEGVRKIAADMEQLAGDGDLATAASKMPSLESELARLKEAIGKL